MFWPQALMRYDYDTIDDQELTPARNKSATQVPSLTWLVLLLHDPRPTRAASKA